MSGNTILPIIFGSFTIVSLFGSALLRVFFNELDVRTKTLLSPAIGSAAIVCLLFVISKFGTPIKNIAPFLVLLVVTISLLSLMSVSKSGLFRLILFQSAIFLSLIPTIWPLFQFGTNWISFGNDDMANYVLGGTRFYNQGFDFQPNLEKLDFGLDYSQAYYWFHSVEKTRPGSELFIALTSYFSSGNSSLIFMSALTFLQAAFISSCLALKTNPRGYRFDVIALSVFAVAPLISLSYYFQLIGQIGGLLFSITNIILLSKYAFGERLHIRTSTGLAITFAAQLIWYPELLPFVALSLLIFFIRNRSKLPLSISDYIKRLFGVLILSTLLVKSYLLDAFRFMFFQILGAQVERNITGTELFPYFLKPRGLVSLTGFWPLNAPLGTMAENSLILLAICILLFVTLRSFRRDMSSEVSVSSFQSCLIAFVGLLIASSGFGAFKAALYLQPFFIIFLSNLADLGLQKVTKFLPSIKKVFSSTLTFLCGFLMLSTQQYYASASTGESFQGFNQLSGASSGKMLENLTQLSLQTPKGTTFISTTSSSTHAKLQASLLRNHNLYFEADDFFSNFYREERKKPDSNMLYKEITLPSRFGGNKISVLNGKILMNSYVLHSKSERSIFNYYSMNGTNWELDGGNLEKNIIFFKSSTQGQSYFSPNRKAVGLYEVERDPMYQNSTIQATGRKFIFQVINYKSGLPLIIELTSSFLPQFDFALPDLKIVGQDVTFVKGQGFGAARLVLDGIEPYFVDDRAFIQIEFLRYPKTFESKDKYLSKLYGESIKTDPRAISSFIRSIRYGDGTQNRITRVSFDSLNKQNFAYSGFFEDGWASKISSLSLNLEKVSFVRLQGMIPGGKQNSNYGNSIEISVNGRAVGQNNLKFGFFEIVVPIAEDLRIDNSLIQFKFDDKLRISNDDRREVGGLLTSLELIRD